jgi:acyl dehydratase
MRYFEDYTVGEQIAVGSHTVTKEGIIEFASRWDPQPIHTDEEAARRSPFGGIIASGCHLVAISIRLISGSDIGASVLVAAGWDEIRFLAPVRPGDRLSLTVETVLARPSKSKPDRGIVRDKFTLTNQHGEKVLGFIDTIFVARRGPTPSPTD